MTVRCPSCSASDLLATAATLLFVNGQASETTDNVVRRFARALGVEVDLLLRWGEIVLLVSGEPARVLPAKPTQVDMGRVTAVLHIIDAAEAGRMSREELRAALDAAACRPPASAARFAVMAAAGACAHGVIFGGQEIATFAVIAFSAGCGAALRRALSHVSANALLQPFCAALLAGAAGVLAIRAGLGVDARLVLVCPCLVLVPGPHVLNGTIDLARARIPLGSARLVFAGLLVLMICAGLLLGLTVGDIELPTAGAAVRVPWSHDMIAAVIAVAAYGSFFNMPWRLLAVPVVVGVVAHSGHWLLLSWGASLTAASLVACLIVGSMVTPAAAWLRNPFAALAFVAVVSMMPGVFLFDAAAALVELTVQGAGAPAQLLVAAVTSGISALLILLAMTVGLIVPKMTMEGSRLFARLLRA